MRNDSNPKSDDRYGSLAPFSIGLDRLSHLVRSKIGLAQAVLDDMVAGYEVENEDIESGQKSLRKVVETLNGIRELATPLHYEASEQCFSELAREEAIACISAYGFKVSFDSIDTPRVRALDEQAIRRALRCIYRYVATRLTNSEAPRDTQVRVVVARYDADHDIVTVGIPEKRVRDYPAGNSNLSLDELVDIDHRPDSVGLLYVSQLVRILGGEARCGFTTDDSFTMCVCL